MGGCVGISSVQQKQDVIVRKVKLSQMRVKQREENKKNAAFKELFYFGQDTCSDMDMDQYSKQGHLLSAVGIRSASTFFGSQTSDQKGIRIFQPMLKNMVLDHQESFPRWLMSDEQFRNDQMTEFLEKCQETAKLQSQEMSDVQKNSDEDNDSGGGEDEDEGDEDGKNNRNNSRQQYQSYQQQQQKSGKISQFNKSSNISSAINKSTVSEKEEKDQSENSDDDEDSNGKLNNQQGDSDKLLNSKGKQGDHSKPGSSSGISILNNKKVFKKSKSILDDKSQLSKKNAVESSDSEENSSDEDRKGGRSMHKLQDIQGLHGSSRNHSRQASPQQTTIEKPLTIQIPDGGGNNSSRHLHSHRETRQSNPNNHYVIKEFKIVKNTWVHTAICLAEIRTPTSLLEFKRRYFYEFDKLSAFLSQLLALKRMDFPNLFTFSYVQIGEASYSGDLAALKKRLEAHKNQNNTFIANNNQQYNLNVFQPSEEQQQQRGSREPSILPGVIKRPSKRTATLLMGNSQLQPGQRSGMKKVTKLSAQDHEDDDDYDDEDESRLIMYIDRIFPDCGKTLEEVINQSQPGEDILKICLKGFRVFDVIANTLCKMHRAGFSYRVLRPSMVRIFHWGSKDFTAYLDSPDFVWDETEQNYLSKNVQTEADFMLYDCKCLSSLMIFFFLTLQEMRQKRRDSKRETPVSSMIFTPSKSPSMHDSLNVGQANNNPIKYAPGSNLAPSGGLNSSAGSLQCISNLPTFSDLIAIEDPVELETILKKLKLPQIALETIDSLAIADIRSQKSIEEFAVKLQGVLEKGPQTAFKHDSLSAYLSYHGSRPLKNENNHVYFRRKNQVHFYEFESKTFKVIKLVRKKQKFQVRTHLTFCHYDNCFYFFAAPNSNKVVKIPLNTNSTERHVINQKSEVIFFKSVKNIPIEEPQILSVIPDDFSFSLYIFNSRKNTDNDTNDVYYNSFIINIEYKQANPAIDDWKEKIQVLEGPRNYTWRRKSFHFYDPHNKFIYCILDSNNIFEKGIRYSYFDTSVEKGDFKDGNLRFACSTEEVFEEFCELSMNLDQVEFCVEVQHGVFLLQASKNIYILDFNYKCYYSFSTLKQLVNYQRNNQRHPHRYQYAYEILNQPFEVKFNNSLNLGKNVVFQEGMLHMLGRKEIETVICSYELLPTQGVMVLKKCISLHSFDDILLKIPKQLIDIWNFQEFKRIIFVQDKKEQESKLLGHGATMKTIKPQNNGQPANSQNENNTIPNTNSSGQQNLKNAGTLANTNNQSGKNTPQASKTLASSQTGYFGADGKTKPQTATIPQGAGMHMTEQGNPLSKIDENKIQQFILKMNKMVAGMDGTHGEEEGMTYHEDQFNVLSVFQETNDFQLIRIMHQSQAYTIRKSNIQNIEAYEQFIHLLELNSSSNYLMQIKQCFMTQDEETGVLSVNIVEEDTELCLLDELNKRCQMQVPFKSQEVGQILKAIFKAVMGLQKIELAHGQISPRVVYFTSKGFIRLAGWYLENREGFENDFIDVCSLLYQVATLDFNENEQFTLTTAFLQENQEKLKPYPGLFSFLLNNLLILQDGDTLDLDKLNEDVKEVFQSLQVHSLKVNRQQLASSNRHVFWVGYGSNLMISCPYEELSFCKNEIIFHNNIVYKFSKYNMFTFDHERTMYVSGALKEDFKTPSQLFYSIDFSFIHQTKAKLRQLKDIPNSVLQPSLFYCNEYVYCIGGYQIKFDGSKSISKKAYRYSIKTEEWEQIKDMPVGVVSATVISGKDNEILYLFGGVSEDVDLRGKELNYLTYEIEIDQWKLKMDLSIKSPFVNNRYVKPLIDHIGNDIFISVDRRAEAIYVQFFELSKGGINIKFKIEEEKEDVIKENFGERDIFTDIKYQDYFKAYQDDLSMIFVHDTVYLLDEFSNTLITINFANFNNIKYDRIPCGVIAVDKANNGFNKQLSLDRQTSIDSFYFNGY